MRDITCDECGNEVTMDPEAWALVFYNESYLDQEAMIAEFERVNPTLKIERK